MIHLQFNVRNPCSKRFHSYKGYSWQVSKHKAIEVELLKTADIVELHLSITHRQSHAGVEFELGLFGYNFAFRFYDSRHWDYILNKWETYEDTDSKTNS